MGSDYEIARAREKDIMRRFEVVEKAQEFTKAEIIDSKDRLLSQRATILAVQYETYELEEIQIHRQARQYMDNLPSELKAIDDHIKNLENVLNSAAQGHFLPLKECIKSDIERERVVDQNFAEILLDMEEKIPQRGNPVKKPKPSYLDDRFNVFSLAND